MKKMFAETFSSETTRGYGRTPPTSSTYSISIVASAYGQATSSSSIVGRHQSPTDEAEDSIIRRSPCKLCPKCHRCYLIVNNCIPHVYGHLTCKHCNCESPSDKEPDKTTNKQTSTDTSVDSSVDGSEHSSEDSSVDGSEHSSEDSSVDGSDDSGVDSSEQRRSTEREIPERTVADEKMAAKEKVAEEQRVVEQRMATVKDAEEQRGAAQRAEEDALKLNKEGLRLFKKGKREEATSKIEEALGKYEEAVEKFQAAASRKILDVIHNSFVLVIDAFIENKAYGEAQQAIEYARDRFPDKTDTFDEAMEMIKNYTWSPNYKERNLIRLKEEAKRNRIVRLV